MKDHKTLAVNREQERMQERLEGQIANWEEEVKELKEEHSRLRERQHLLLEMKDATSGMSPVSAISPRSRQSRMERDVPSSRIESEVETLKQRIFVAREMICAALEEDALGAQRAVHDKGAVQRRHPARDVERQDLARCSRLPRAHELVPEKRLHSATSSYYIVLSTPEYF